jgi:acyl-CoA hydrolase
MEPKLLEEVACSSPSLYGGPYVVAPTADQVIFRQPIHVGDLVTLLTSVSRKSSMGSELR